jgi:hypothetical protein
MQLKAAANAATAAAAAVLADSLAGSSGRRPRLDQLVSHPGAHAVPKEHKGARPQQRQQRRQQGAAAAGGGRSAGSVP